MGKYTYETSRGKASSAFNVYQARNGGIYITMGGMATKLSSEQITELNIYVYDLKDFDIDDYREHYGRLPSVTGS